MFKTIFYSTYIILIFVLISCNEEPNNQFDFNSPVDNVHLNLLENQAKIRKDYQIDSFYIVEYSFDSKEQHFEYNKDIMYRDFENELLLIDEYNQYSNNENERPNYKNNLDQDKGGHIYYSKKATLNDNGYVTNYTFTLDNHTSDWKFEYNNRGLLTERNLYKKNTIKKTQRFIYFSNNQKLYSSLIDSTYIPTITPKLYARDSILLNIFTEIRKTSKQLNTPSYSTFKSKEL